MVTYKVSGRLYSGIKWEDFYSDNRELPRASIGTESPEKIPDGEEFFVELADDGWHDGYVRELTSETAKKVLARINNVSTDEIEIVELGESLSV